MTGLLAVGAVAVVTLVVLIVWDVYWARQGGGR
jgi:hypothetical protein